ncbi:MAG: 1-deoxy-D-xylulose-5-phosphate reductoisomerase [Lachnospiraceae bacterium]
MKKLAIFGSTGSIGTSTLNVVRKHPEKFSVSILVAGRNISLLTDQIREFSPEHVYISDDENAMLIREQFPGLDVYCGKQGMDEISSLTDFDTAVSALVGIAGLKPTYNIIKNGKTVALANKEVLVTGGSLVTSAAEKYNAALVTVDSEHSAILQCLRSGRHEEIEKLILTASGGPFFDRPITDDITCEQALAHPTWKMGPKITIDSSTMMNKGFEVIEAKWLFNVPPEKIQVAIHRQSIVHSMVEFCDGSIIANIAPPDMELPIAYALDYPERLPMPQRLDIFGMKALEFSRPDLEKFKCLKIAMDAAKMPQSASVAVNGANEVLVDAFLGNKIKFTDIPNGISEILEKHTPCDYSDVEEVLEADVQIRRRTLEYIKSLGYRR